MPYHEPDATDPMELVGVPMGALDPAMLERKAECIAEEFLRFGHTKGEVLGLFLNPNYASTWELACWLGEARIRRILDRLAPEQGDRHA